MLNLDNSSSSSIPDELDTDEQEQENNSQIVLEASRRIYIFDWISRYFIGDSVRRAKFFALSFVGSGFKTLAFMLILTFWSIVWLILCKVALLFNQPEL